MRRLFGVGIILLLWLIGFAYANLSQERVPSALASDEEREIPLLLPYNLDLALSDRTSSEKCLLLPSSVSKGEPYESGGSLLEDETNGDVSFETLRGDRNRRAQGFDIPIVINERVEHFIRYFQTTARKIFTNWLARSERYIPFMKNLLKENGLPEDLVYMALIESGFNPYAYSRSKASGPWQFIYLTGKKYGLKVNWWVDERRDPEKSTVAAAKYLKDLYDLFECWYLAAAGYNAGEGKIINAMKRYRTEDFWELTKYRYLKRETKDYVPQMIAAALIAKEPEKYGFVGIEYQEPLKYDKVKVPGATDLRLIAKACETSLEEIKDLNPELLRWCTPPDSPEYEVRIPFGKKELFLTNFEAFPQQGRFQFKTHIVRKGDTLGAIAKLYKVDLDPILELNRLKRSSLLSIGMNLIIPIPKDGRPTGATQRTMGPNRTSEEMVYVIKEGDTLWSIANETGVNIGSLSRWNNLHPETKLRPGDKIIIRIPAPREAIKESQRREGRELVYIVREGDTLWDIAKRYGVTVEEIKAWNQLGKGDRIYPSDRLRLKVGGIRSSTLN